MWFTFVFDNYCYIFHKRQTVLCRCATTLRVDVKGFEKGCEGIGKKIFRAEMPLQIKIKKNPGKKV